jgi:HEPN domain-containing protein
MSNKEEAMRWFNQGERDLGAAMVLMDKEFHESACFHAQQASENALKSMLFLKGVIQMHFHQVHLMNIIQKRMQTNA